MLIKSHNETEVKVAYSTKDENYLANIALLYYQEGLNQGQIADRLGLSRATIVNYLKEGRDRGIVDIRVNGESLRTSSTGQELRKMFNLADVYIANSGPKSDYSLALRQTARVAALAFYNIIEPGDVIGVAWGETLRSIGENLPNRKIAHTSVCQIIGSMESDRVLSAEDCAIQIANRIGAQCYTLHSPAILSSRSLAQELKQEETIKAQLKRLKNLNAIITSVGDLSDNNHMLSSGIISENDLGEVKDAGGAGWLCSGFIQADGTMLPHQLEKRMIAIQLEDILSTPKRILVASGLKKVSAVMAALRGKFVTHAILDSELAKAILDQS
jgi:deoxyribonucleoside regulator